MKIKLDERKGITLVSLAITVAVLLILASVATYSGVNILRQAKLNKFTTEMKLMQTEINDLYNRYKNGEDVLNLGKDLNEQEEQANKVFTKEASGITDKTGYRYFDKETLEGLDINGVDSEFFVNIEKRSVVSYEGLEYEGVTYYTLEQLPNGLYNVNYQDKETREIEKPTFDVSTSINEDDEFIITVSNIQYSGNIEKWEVKYQKEGEDYWSSSQDLSFKVDSKGIYNVKIVNGDVEAEPVTVSFVTFDGDWNDEKGINMPVIKENMEIVKYDESSKTWINDIDGSSINYTNEGDGKSQWANAKVTVDGVDSYFVWIPRFEYKIDNNKIDVKFISTNKTEADDGYIIHPAFINDVDKGGWTSELPGIWVGKYETSRSDTEGEIEGSSTKIKVQPGVTSLRNISVGDMYTYARNYFDDLNSHMLKNSEWGAVAYLTYSQYGRNGVELEVNENSKNITANGDIEANVKQSSTGNVYGIYDLSGGSYEYVAAYYNGSDVLLNQNLFAGKGRKSTEYVTAYTGTSLEVDYKLGDATYETNGWNGDLGSFIDIDNPYILRGGGYDVKEQAGIFYFNKTNIESNQNYSYRMCLAIQ